MTSVVVIGNFDGVHRGHRAVLDAARAEAPDLPLIVVTFWPHPMSIVRPDRAPLLLTDLPGRIDLLTDAGAREVRVVEFTAQVAAWSPEQFVETVIVPLRPRVVVVGRNFRFGHRAAGDVDTLAALAAGRYRVACLDLVCDEAAVSSTRIREALAAGDVDVAAGLLGRPYRYSGIVVLGDQRGRELGFPTANLTVAPGFACPADGVYAGWLTRLDGQGEPMPAAISVGTNPTFSGMQRRVETYVLDRDDLELYGVPIGVDFVARLRGQVRFTGVDDLIAQMHADVARVRDVLAGRAAPGQERSSDLR